MVARTSGDWLLSHSLQMSLSYEQALKEWRAHEKSTRQSFLTACGDHFLIRLFPTAAEKPGPPRVSVCKAASPVLNLD